MGTPTVLRDDVAMEISCLHTLAAQRLSLPYGAGGRTRTRAPGGVCKGGGIMRGIFPAGLGESAYRSDALDHGGAAVVERVGHRVGVRIPRTYSFPVFLPALHQRFGLGRHRRRHG
jgi:hypothetical protein